MTNAHKSSTNLPEPLGTRHIFSRFLFLMAVGCVSSLSLSCAESSGASNRTSEPPTDTCDQTGEMMCGDRCIDTRYSGAHCGGCAGEGGEVCSGNTVCSEGRCQANCTLATQSRCGNSCSDLESDRQNCGACGRACGPGLSCVGGVCACPDPLVMCGSECVDVRTDTDHCGGCYNRVSVCDATPDIDPCEEINCTGERCYCDSPLCASRPECAESLYSQQCPLPAPTTRCVPECAAVNNVYRQICTQLSGQGLSGNAGIGSGAGTGGGDTGGGTTTPIARSPGLTNLLDNMGEIPTSLGSNGTTDAAGLPVSDSCEATKSFKDNMCGPESCTVINRNGFIAVDPNVEVVGSLSRPGDETDCFTFVGKDDGIAETVEVKFSHIPAGHDYDIEIYSVEQQPVTSCGDAKANTDPAVPGDTSLTYKPGILGGNSNGQYFVVIKRVPGVGSDCGGEYRLIINGLN